MPDRDIKILMQSVYSKMLQRQISCWEAWMGSQHMGIVATSTPLISGDEGHKPFGLQSESSSDIDPYY